MGRRRGGVGRKGRGGACAVWAGRPEAAEKHPARAERRSRHRFPPLPAASPGRRRHVPHALRIRPVSALPLSPPLTRALPASRGLRLSHGPAAGHRHPHPGRPWMAPLASRRRGAALRSWRGRAQPCWGAARPPACPARAAGGSRPAGPWCSRSLRGRPLPAAGSSLCFYFIYILERRLLLNTGEGSAGPVRPGASSVGRR